MKKKNIIIIVITFILVVLLVGISFAFFRSITKVDKELVIGSLEIDYVEGSEIKTSLKPIKEDEVLDKAYKLEFSISNINDVDIMSEVKLHINNISDNIKNDLKYKLYENDFELVDGNFTNSNVDEDLLLRDELYYEPGKTKNYVLYIYIEDNDNNQNYIVGNKIDMKVVVEGKKITKTDMIRTYNSHQNDDHRYFWIDEYKQNIKEVDFVDYITLDNAITLSNGTGVNYWDMSVDEDESVIAWLENNEDNTYHLYIGTNKDYIFATHCSVFFYNFINLENINFGKVFRTDNVTDMFGMFWDCKKIKTLDLKYFDTSNATNVGYYMFRECTNLESIDLSSINTSKALNFDCMFYVCDSLKELDLSKFDTSSIRNMRYMFSSCESLKELDVSNFDTSNVTSMYSMFGNCHLLTKIDVSSFDTSKVTSMNRMFGNCKLLKYLDLSNFDTSNVTDMGVMFYHCESLKYLDLSNFDTSKVINMEVMFQFCYDLEKLDLSHFNTSNVTNMFAMFCYCRSLKYLNLNNFNTSKVTSMHAMFNGCSSLTSLDLSSFDVSSVIDKENMFSTTVSIKEAYAKDEETANFFNNGTTKPSTYEFVVKT